MIRHTPRLCPLVLLLAACGSDGGGGGGGTPDSAGTGGQTVTDGGDNQIDFVDLVDAAVTCDRPQPVVACPSPEAGALPYAPTGFEHTEDAFLTQNPDARYGADDLVGPETANGALTGRIARGRGLSANPVVNERVVFFTWDGTGRWANLGETRTGDDGKYSFAPPAFGTGSHKVYAVVAGDASCNRQGVYDWPAGTKAVLTDIDGTLTTSDGELLQEMSNASYDPAMYPGANDMLNAWSNLGYRVIYLSARPHQFRSMTEAWLVRHGFPDGPIYTADSLVLGEAAATYKKGVLAHLQSDLGVELSAVYGNADTDIEAYPGSNLTNDHIFIIGPLAGNSDTTAIADGDYTAHIASYIHPLSAITPPPVETPYCAAP